MSTDYQHYVQQTFDLARSVTLKSEMMATKINHYLEQLGYLTPTEPREWKYYLNLSGRYHAYDESMSVVSLDTHETLVRLCPDTLNEHPITKKHYTLDSDFYRRLVARYPEQELLIRGILNPIDVDLAVEAPDHSIIDIDETLIDPNEQNLVDVLQKRINWFYDRWDVSGYHMTDDLYTTAHLALLYVQLPLMLFNIRLANCHTYYAHSFHIKEYLKSHNRLDRYYDYLTRRQRLFLYRNIAYIRNNAGRQETFDWLIDNLLTQRSIGAAEYVMLQDTTNLPHQLRPDPLLLRRPINAYHRSTRKDPHTLADLLVKQRPLAIDNDNVENETLRVETQRIVSSSRNEYPTKALESSMIDRSIGGYVPFVEFLVNHWIDWVDRGQYGGKVSLKLSGAVTSLDLSHKEVLCLYYYVYNRSMGTVLEHVPVITPRLITRPNPPTVEALSDKVAGKVDRQWIKYILSLHPQSTHTDNTLTFFNTISEYYAQLLKKREAFALEEDPTLRAYKEAIVFSTYETRPVTLTEETQDPVSYVDWLNERNINFDTTTKEEFKILSHQLLKESAGVALNGNLSLFDIQNAMVRLLGELSSYSVHFLREINPGPIHDWDWPAVRQTLEYSAVLGEQKIRVIPHNVIWTKSHGTSTVSLPTYAGNTMTAQSHQRIQVPLNLTEHVRITSRESDYLRLPLPTTHFTIDE